MPIHLGNEASENMRYLLHWKFFSPRFVEFQIVLIRREDVISGDWQDLSR
jgi:hypothetical protein